MTPSVRTKHLEELLLHLTAAVVGCIHDLEPDQGRRVALARRLGRGVVDLAKLPEKPAEKEFAT